MFDTIAISVQFPTKKYFLENCTWTFSKGVFFIKFMMNLFFILGLGDSSIAQFPKISILLASFRFVTISLAIKKSYFSHPIQSNPFITLNCIQCYVPASMYARSREWARERRQNWQINGYNTDCLFFISIWIGWLWKRINSQRISMILQNRLLFKMSELSSVCLYSIKWSLTSLYFRFMRCEWSERKREKQKSETEWKKSHRPF